MARQFIKKEGMAIASVARYLLGVQCNSRLKTIDELSQNFELSVGVVQNALKTLEGNGFVTLERCGRNGTLILSIDYQGLFSQANIHNLVCAIALPYTKQIEGIASGLKAQFQQVPLYFAHMRGADTRIECLMDGIHDIAVVSRLAAESYLNKNLVEIAFSLGEYSYVDAHQLICRQGEHNSISRVGLDMKSPDQRLLTEIFFKNKEIELVNIAYHDGIKLIKKRMIDAMVWSIADQLTSGNLMSIPMTDHPVYQKASEAVILTKKENSFMNQLIKRLINLEQLQQHQMAVRKGLIEPTY